MEEPHTVDDDTPPTRQTNEAEGAYWKENARLLVSLMSIWFAVSFGAGILFREQLDQFSIGGYPLGFWFAQQGSIYCFILLIVVYARVMNRLDRELLEGTGAEEGS